MKAILDTKAATADNSYKDDIPFRYHFPNRYLRAAEKSVGDWIIYREAARGGGSKGYMAVARLESIVPDPEDPKRSYAEMSGFLRFDHTVPFEGDSGYYEERFNGLEKRHVGPSLRGNSIREISDREFADIVQAGLSRTFSEILAGSETDASKSDNTGTGIPGPSVDDEAVELPLEWRDRAVTQLLCNRKVRDPNFRLSVMDAYDSRCAVTGLRMINGGGKAEAQAAHIWPVAEGGPDIVQNGIALSATCHWLFDRHLISLTDDYGLLVSHNKVPPEMRQLFDGQRERIRLPADQARWPHRGYIERHRERFVGG